MVGAPSIPGNYRDNTTENKIMYISHNNKQNYAFCKLKLLVEKSKHCLFIPTNQALMKVPKVLIQGMGTTIINNPIFLPSLKNTFVSLFLFC